MLASVAGVGCIVAPRLESIRLSLADAAVGDCAIVVCGWPLGVLWGLPSWHSALEHHGPRNASLGLC
jgi:hypothetical protein